MGSLKPAEAEFIAKLAAALPGVIRDVDPRYLEEQRKLFTGTGAAVARPKTTQEVAVILRHCAEARVPVVPYGGGTGLVGAQTVTEGPPDFRDDPEGCGRCEPTVSACACLARLVPDRWQSGDQCGRGASAGLWIGACALSWCGGGDARWLDPQYAQQFAQGQHGL